MCWGLENTRLDRTRQGPSKITMAHYSLKETSNNKSNKKGRNTVCFFPNKCCCSVFLEGKNADKQ